MDLVWKALVDSGVNPSYALGLCVFFNLKGQYVTSSLSRDERVSSESFQGIQLNYCYPHSGDQPFNYSISFKKLSGKKYQKVDVISGHYGVCNFIWDKTEKKEGKKTYELAGQCVPYLREEKPLPIELVKAIHDLD